MRKVVSGLFISLDGVVEAPHLWQFDVFDDDMGQLMTEQLAKIDTVLLGRVTYQEWAAYWPQAEADEEYAVFINNTPKYVASTTLGRLDWQNSILIEGDVAAAVAALKAQPGGNIGVQGSPTLIRFLLAAGLLDELTLMVHPVIAGAGRRLFPGDSELQRMTLIDSRITASGVAALTYRPLKA
jgi:dihydrofolate reductase